MQDSEPTSPENALKYWYTTEKEPTILYEFKNKDGFKNNKDYKTIQLQEPFSGNSHVIYKSSFYYHRNGTNRLQRLDLKTSETSSMTIHDASYLPQDNRLYELNYNHMDISVDENGLWVIFASNNTNNTLVMKLRDDLHEERVWNISLDQKQMGEMFVVCGVLYGVESVLDTFTKIRFAFDFRLASTIEINVNFSNPFRENSMINYNPRARQIYAWDLNNLIEYPIKFEEKISDNQQNNIIES